MGLLDQVLGNVLGSRTGGVSGRGGSGLSNPLVMAVLSLLVQQAMKRGGTPAGGQGGGLGDALGGGLGGLLGGSGGLGGLLGGSSGGTGGLGGGLNGSTLASGLGGLLESFNRSGHGDIANSWVSTGENRPVAPDQLADALGPDTVDQLSQQTGLPQQNLLAELSHVLPGVVDQLTPQGRLPREDELN